jgi:hypothetical protein
VVGGWCGQLSMVTDTSRDGICWMLYGGLCNAVWVLEAEYAVQWVRMLLLWCNQCCGVLGYLLVV